MNEHRILGRLMTWLRDYFKPRCYYIPDAYFGYNEVVHIKSCKCEESVD